MATTQTGPFTLVLSPLLPRARFTRGSLGGWRMERAPGPDWAGLCLDALGWADWLG